MINTVTSNGVRTVTLSRPEKANALTRQMLAALLETLHQARDERAVILTGVGKVFSAGADLDEARAGLAKDNIWEEVSAAVAACRGMTIAALNGTVAGGAMGMVLACDLRLAVPTAKAFYPVMKLGFLPQPSDAPRLIRLVGPGAARLMLMGGAKLDAAEALRLGLFDRLCDDPVARAHDLLTDAVAAPQDVLFGIKDLLR